jgi:hypothetical protein
MSSFVIALMFGIGVGSFAWTKMARGTGNAEPAKLAGGAAIIGFVAALFAYSILKWILHI